MGDGLHIDWLGCVPYGEALARQADAVEARRAGATVEPELVELVLRDLSPRGAAPDASALPMMSHALLATWKQARNARLRVSDYVAVGGVAGAVQRTAEQVYGSLDEDGRATARWLFSQLVNVDAEKFTVWQKTDNKPLTESLYQFSHAPLYVDRREALAAADAHRLQGVAALAAVQLVGQGGEDPGPRCPDRVSK